MGIKDLHDKVVKHAREDMALTGFAGMTIAIDAAPYVIKAWYNDMPSFFRAGATRTHSQKLLLLL